MSSSGRARQHWAKGEQSGQGIRGQATRMVQECEVHGRATRRRGPSADASISPAPGPTPDPTCSTEGHAPDGLHFLEGELMAGSRKSRLVRISSVSVPILAVAAFGLPATQAQAQPDTRSSAHLVGTSTASTGAFTPSGANDVTDEEFVASPTTPERAAPQRSRARSPTAPCLRGTEAAPGS